MKENSSRVLFFVIDYGACWAYGILWREIANTSDALYFYGWVGFEVVAEACDIDIEAAEVKIVIIAPKFLQEF